MTAPLTALVSRWFATLFLAVVATAAPAAAAERGAIEGLAVPQTPLKPLPTRQATSTTTLRPMTQRATLSVPPKQQAEDAPDGAVEVVETAVVDQAPSASGSDGQGPKAEQAKLLQMLLQAQFDRRPSTILEVWAEPELRPFSEEELSLPENKDLAAQRPKEPAAVPDAEIPDGATEEQANQLRQAVEQRRTAAQQGYETALKNFVQTQEQKRLVEMFSRDVTLGRWSSVAQRMSSFEEAEQWKIYANLLTQLGTVLQDAKARGVPQQLQEKHAITFEDVLDLAAMSPGKMGKKQIETLVPLLRAALEQGNVFEVWLSTCRDELQKDEAERRVSRRQIALILAELGKDVEMAEFLPTVDEAIATNDRGALNLRARHHVAKYQQDEKPEHLQAAWHATQAALAAGELGKEHKAEALRRAVELVPKLGDAVGTDWLVQSFVERPERGMEIMATIGSQAARGFQQSPGDASERRLGLVLQRAAVDALFRVAPQLAEEWRPTLHVLAGNWLVEAGWSDGNSRTSTLKPYMRRDAFGNIYYEQRQGRGGPIAAVEPDELLASRPDGDWLTTLDASLRPHITTMTARLLLKVGEDAEAFPYIEELAALNPRICKELADEFLRVWMKNHDPNRSSNTDSYMFIYGFDRRASGIPLTRSKQDRNLEDLAKWVARLRSLPIADGVDEELLGQAFRVAHSSAEVYQLDTIEAVFGDLGQLDPVMLSELLGSMRTNLATTWRRPDVQEEAKTRRSQQDIALEVTRGYATALVVAEKAMQNRERHWALLSAQGALLHDLNNFQNELQRSTDFADKRRAAFALFEQAADDYLGRVGDMRPAQETTKVFELWFYGALGACDLGAIDESTVLDRAQLPKIQEYLASLPAPQSKRHTDRFANLVFTRMSAVRPQIKWRYLDAAFEIVGDHPLAYEAKKVFDYYKDLTAEIQLVARVDGDTAVGTEPFGVMIDLEHTVEIERESGGFQKYLQNQNNMQFAYNYGRPTENYRDKFYDAVLQALDENFDVKSVTFNSETATSIALERQGWRKTPYAYVLLQARGPQIDRIPEMKIDLDFLDTSGFVILPITSSPVVVDASRSAGDSRPFEELSVTQVLDERKASEGRLLLEMKAEALGLVPDLETLAPQAAAGDAFPGFRVKQIDDQGVSINRFDESQLGVRSERMWLLTLVAEDESSPPKSFRFASVTDRATPIYQRYVDADLATVEQSIELVSPLGDGLNLWLWIGVGFLVVLGGGWWFVGRSRTGGVTQEGVALQMPSHLTPFSVLQLLRQIDASGRLPADARQDLRGAIAQIEEHFFARGQGDGPDLRQLAAEWLRRAS